VASDSCAASMSPNEAYLACGGMDGSLLIWNTSDGALECALRPTHGQSVMSPIVCCSCSPQGLPLVSGDTSGSLVWWTQGPCAYIIVKHTVHTQVILFIASASTFEGRFGFGQPVCTYLPLKVRSFILFCLGDFLPQSPAVEGDSALSSLDLLCYQPLEQKQAFLHRAIDKGSAHYLPIESPSIPTTLPKTCSQSCPSTSHLAAHTRLPRLRRWAWRPPSGPCAFPPQWSS